MSAMIYRYAEYKNLDMSFSDLREYTDSSEISEYAKSAAAWASGRKIINGFDDSSFKPCSDATRAQAAAVFMNLLNI